MNTSQNLAPLILKPKKFLTKIHSHSLFTKAVPYESTSIFFAVLHHTFHSTSKEIHVRSYSNYYRLVISIIHFFTSFYYDLLLIRCLLADLSKVGM